MAEQPPPRRRFRPLRWSLFGLALVGLGFLLEDWLSPLPRCTIYSEFGVLCLPPDGTTVITGPQRNPFAGPRAFPQQETVLPSQGPLQAWDTRSGLLRKSYLQDKRIRHGFFSPSFRYAIALQEWESDFDPADEDPEKRLPKKIGEPGIYHLVDLHGGTEKQFVCPGFPAVEEDVPRFEGQSLSPKDTFLFCYGQPSLLIETATGRIVQRLDRITTFYGFVPDESLMVLGRKDGSRIDLEIWNTKSHERAQTLANVKGAVLAPNGAAVAANLSDGLTIMDLTTFQLRRLGPCREFSSEENPFSPDGKTLVTFTDGKMEIWDVPHGKLRGNGPQKISQRYNPICTFSPNSSCFALVVEKELSLWDVSSTSLLWKKEKTDQWLQTRFTPDSRFVIVCRWDVIGNTNTMVNVEYEVVENKTGQASPALPIGVEHNVRSDFDFTGDFRLLTIRNITGRQPHFLARLLGDWWPGKNGPQEQVRVVDVASGAVVASLETEGGVTSWLSDDGRTLVTQNAQGIHVWDLPLRPPLRLVIGIPLGLGLLVLLFSRWRARRRGRTAVATVGPVTMNPEQKT